MLKEICDDEVPEGAGWSLVGVPRRDTGMLTGHEVASDSMNEYDTYSEPWGNKKKLRSYSERGSSGSNLHIYVNTPSP